MNVAGVVLAGGLSRRMGQDKANLCYQGTTLLERCVKLLQHSDVDDVLISRNQPDCINDIYPQSGPLGGMHAVMSQYSFDAYLFVPVDMPLLTPKLLKSLLFSTVQSQLMCCYQSCYLPIALPNSDEIVRFMQQQMHNNGKRSVKYMLEQFEHQQIVCSDPARLVNINSLEDWQQLGLLS